MTFSAAFLSHIINGIFPVRGVTNKAIRLACYRMVIVCGGIGYMSKKQEARC